MDSGTPLLKAREKAKNLHGRIPYLRKIPFPNLAIIISVILLNAIVWAAVGVLLHYNHTLVGTAVLAYTLGLRHALDADHIAAIDLMTRRLIASGQKPIAVGFFFSLGHSTIVIITSIAVAATSAALSERFDDFSRVGGIVGTSVSATFLLVLAGINVWVLVKLWKQMGEVVERERAGESGEDVERDVLRDAMVGGGWMVRCFKGVFRVVDRAWKMYPLGCLFGLGFDTSSEVALLGIASIEAAKGTSVWLIMIFPVLFTVGMCLLDTTDGSLMSALYQTSEFTNDIVAVMYYSIVLTVITVIVAVVIGVIQLLSLVLNAAEPKGRFWDGVEKVGEYYDVIGGCIVALFLVGAIAGVVCYRPWRRWIEKRAGEREEGREEDTVLPRGDDGIETEVDVERQAAVVTPKM